MVAILRGENIHINIESLLAGYNFDLLPDCRAAGSFVSGSYLSVIIGHLLGNFQAAIIKPLLVNPKVVFIGKLDIKG